MYYLQDNPPKRSQYRTRRDKLSGAVVVHTAEAVVDDRETSAERVSSFIRNRDTPGSYHTIVDSNSTVELIDPLRYEAYGEGTGGNRHAMHLSYAGRASDWNQLSVNNRSKVLLNMADAAAVMNETFFKATGKTIPARFITLEEYKAKQPGFIGHANVDPGRRSDPGSTFPWQRFFKAYSAATTRGVSHDKVCEQREQVAELQKVLNRNGGNLSVDGLVGPLTLGALNDIAARANKLERARELAATLGRLLA